MNTHRIWSFFALHDPVPTPLPVRRFPNRPLLTALCQAAVRKMHIFNAQHMANMTWAMATLAHKAGPLDHQRSQRSKT